MSTTASLDQARAVCTASAEQSIWREVAEATFRTHLVELEQLTNAVPVGPQVFSPTQWLQRHHVSDTLKHGSYTLQIHEEQRLADDFAALAAVDQGAQSVSAACVEEQISSLGSGGITIRLAAVDAQLDGPTETALRRICDDLAIHAANVISAAESSSASSDDASAVIVPRPFDHIVRLHLRRLLARLRSSKWEKPQFLSRTHKKPLWQDLPNLLHRVQFLFTRKEAPTRSQVEAEISALAAVYEDFEQTKTTMSNAMNTDSGAAAEQAGENEVSRIKWLVQQSYTFCKSTAIRTYTQRLEAAAGASMTSSDSTKPTKRVTPQISSALKTLHQIEKIAAYYRIACSLTELVTRHPKLFVHGIRLSSLPPYTSVATDISYEPWAKSTHVHAEVQLAVYYDMAQKENQQPSDPSPLAPTTTVMSTTTTLAPRTVGASKRLCFLCHLFLTLHGSFFPANTHGRLYDQWTIPDLSDYSSQVRLRYRDIIAGMDQDVCKRTEELTTTTAVESQSEARESTFVGVHTNSGTGRARGRGDGAVWKWRPEPMTSRENLILRDEG